MQGRILGIALAGLCLLLSMQFSQAAEPIRVGVTISLTGDYALLGKDELDGIRMWADDVNERGALLGRKVEIVSYDDASDPEKSAELYEKLITQDKVDLLLGPYSSDITLAASRVAEQHNFPMVATGAASSAIWDQGFSNIFQIDAPAHDYMQLPLQLASEKGLQRIALVYADSEFPQEVAAGVRSMVAEHGMQLVFDEAYPQDSTDFGRIAQRIKATSPDVMLGGTYFDDSVALVRASRQAGLQPKIMALTVGPAQAEFGKQLGDDAEGIMGAISWMRSGKMPLAYDFSFRYKQKYGHNAAVHAAYGYGAGQILEAAVRLAGSLDRDAIREQLRSMIFRSLLGHYRVDDTGKQTAKKTYVMQWQHGYRLLVMPTGLADIPVQYP
ncbi:MAG: amino acid ABC transporter substrate-binding protein [Pseudomonadota bacterium]